MTATAASSSQWVNYDGHRSLFESRSKNRMGLLMWMSHPCWPSMVWQTYDYYFEPTAAYFGIKKACEPLHIQWNPATDEVEVVNYHAGAHADLTAHVQVLNMDASVAWESEAKVNSQEDTTEKCIKLQFPDNLTKVHFIKLTLKEGDKVVSENFYHRSKEENNYQDLKQLAKVALQSDLQYEQDANGEWHDPRPDGSPEHRGRGRRPAIPPHLLRGQLLRVVARREEGSARALERRGYTRQCATAGGKRV